MVSEIHDVLAVAPAPIRATRAAKIAAESKATIIEALRATPDRVPEGVLVN